MRVWVDLDNAPHVPFFKPLVRALEDRGCAVEVTLRDFGYTRSLADEAGIPHTPIARHPGKNLLAKVMGLATRSLRLAAWARPRAFDVAVSHGSRALVCGARLIGVPTVTMFDYEHVSSSLFERFSRKLLLPEALRERFTSPLCHFYPGYKEEVYLGDFTPGSDPVQIDHAQDAIIVVIRPPATSAHYHDHRSEAILEAVLSKIGTHERAFGIIAPRTREQGAKILKSLQNPLKFHILQHSVNGLELVSRADLVVGGGGTMNRESALLGIPTYSIFTGPKGTIDARLEEEGRMTFLDSPEDVTEIKVKYRPTADSEANTAELSARSTLLRDKIVDEILDVAESPSI